MRFVDSQPPYVPSVLTELVETDVEDTFCQEGSFTDAIGADVGTMFHNYSDILIATSFLSATPSPFYTGVSTWVQDVNETHYTGCASVIGGGSPKEDYIMLVIYQKNLHTRIRESPWTSGIMQGGSIKLDAWKRGSQCVTNMNKVSFFLDTTFLKSWFLYNKLRYTFFLSSNNLSVVLKSFDTLPPSDFQL